MTLSIKTLSYPKSGGGSLVERLVVPSSGQGFSAIGDVLFSLVLVLRLHDRTWLQVSRPARKAGGQRARGAVEGVARTAQLPFFFSTSFLPAKGYLSEEPPSVFLVPHCSQLDHVPLLAAVEFAIVLMSSCIKHCFF